MGLVLKSLLSLWFVLFQLLSRLTFGGGLVCVDINLPMNIFFKQRLKPCFTFQIFEHIIALSYNSNLGGFCWEMTLNSMSFCLGAFGELCAAPLLQFLNQKVNSICFYFRDQFVIRMDLEKEITQILRLLKLRWCAPYLRFLVWLELVSPVFWKNIAKYLTAPSEAAF